MSSYDRLKEFLKQREVKNNEKVITHLSMKGGKFHIPLKENKDFFKLYLDAINDGHKLYIVECLLPGKLMRFALDIEIKREHILDENITGSFITSNLIPSIIKKIMVEVNKYNDYPNIQYVMSKRADYLIHINFPQIIISISNARRLANTVSKLMAEECKGVNWSKAIDTTIYTRGKGLRLLGSHALKELKPGENPYYLPVENGEYVPISLEYLINTSIRTDIVDTEITNDQSYFDETHASGVEDIDRNNTIIKNYLESIQHHFKYNNITRINSIKKIFYPGSVKPCIAVSIKASQCPFKGERHQRKSDPLYIWITSKGSCMKCYDSDHSKMIYPAQLIPLSKEMKIQFYNDKKEEVVPEPEEIIELTDEDITQIEKVLASYSHYDVACFVYYLYKDRFRVNLGKKNSSWYEFRNHRFNKDIKTLDILLSTEVVTYFNSYKYIINDGVNENIDELIRCLKTSNYKSSVISQAANIFYNKHHDFIDKLDSNIDLLCFNNGILDLSTMEFREGRPEDNVSLCTHNNYVEYDEDDETIKDIEDFLSKVFKDPDVKLYQLKKIASCLRGHIDEEFNIWTGNGSNGKSKLSSLISKALGDYWCSVPVTLFTKARVTSSAPSPEIMAMKGRRFGDLQEPEQHDKIHNGIMKHISGGDKITGRQLYGETEEFKLQIKMFMSCNKIPNIACSDNGTWRRLKIVHFKTKFVKNPVKDHEELIDPELEIKMENWGEKFLSMLVHYYKRYIKEGNPEPQEVKDYIKEVREDYDIFSQFVIECIEDHSNDIVNEENCSEILTPFIKIYNKFIYWLESRGIKRTLYNKTEVKKYITDNFGSEKAYKFSSKVVKGYKLSIKQTDNSL